MGIKNKVDELLMEMSYNQMKSEEELEMINAEIGMLAQKKAQLTMLLSEARSNMVGDREELKNKEAHQRTLNAEFDETEQRGHGVAKLLGGEA